MSLVPLLRLARRPRAARLHRRAGSPSSCSCCCRGDLWDAVFGKLAMDFSTWIVAGLMIVVGTVWVIVFNADLLLGARHAGLRPHPEPRAGPAHVHGVSARGPLPHRHDARDVHARRLHARHRDGVERILRARDRRRRLRRRVPGARRHGRRGADRPTWRPRSRRAPGIDPSDFPSSAASRSWPSRRSSSARARPDETYLVRGPRPAVPRAHDVRARRRWRAATPPPQRCGTQCETHPGLAVVDSTIVPRRDNWNFGVPPDFALTGLPLRGGPSTRSRSRCATSRPGRRLQLTVIGILKDTAPLEMVGISTSQQTLASAFPGRAQPDDPLLRARARGRPGGRRRRSSSPRSSRTGSRRSRSRRSSTTRSPPT